MFDNIGVDPDEEALKRQAKAGLLTTLALGSVAAAVFGYGAMKVTEAVLDVPLDEALTELILDEEEDMGEAPPPPPPPPAPSRRR